MAGKRSAREALDAEKAEETHDAKSSDRYLKASPERFFGSFAQRFVRAILNLTAQGRKEEGCKLLHEGKEIHSGGAVWMAFLSAAVKKHFKKRGKGPS